LRSVAKQSYALAAAVVEAGAVEALVQSLECFDSSVKEAAAYGLDYIARHASGISKNHYLTISDLAQRIVDHQGIEPLLLCAQEPELSLKQVAVCAVTDIVKHTPEVLRQTSY
jgi:hypothetical protein